MRSAVLVTVVLSALALAGSASAGCFATAGLTAPPATVGPGDTWNAQITVKQHGTRPIPDAQPTLTIIAEDGARTEFAAKPTDTVGVYVASVVFPAAGTWDYEVNDGFVDSGGGQSWDCSSTHTFSAVTIGGSGSSGAGGDPTSAAPSPVPAAAGDDGIGTFAIVLILAAAAFVVAAGVGFTRRAARRHASA